MSKFEDPNEPHIRPKGYSNYFERNTCINCKHRLDIKEGKDTRVFCTKLETYFEVNLEDFCDEFESDW